MPSHALSIKDARKLFLASQGLHRARPFGSGKTGAARAIRQLGYVQIDTISVVNRAHQHVLNSRVPNFKHHHLQSLMQERQVFEYWSHAAAFMPMENYRYSLPVKRGWAATRQSDRKLTRFILDRIRNEGPLQSRDFEDTRKQPNNGWWQWKPAKRALEHLFMAGELMVSHREGFQKVYDLTESIVPTGTDTTEPGIDEWAEFIIASQVAALGVATEPELGYARSSIRRLAGIALKTPLNQAINALLEQGRLVQVDLAGVPAYSTVEQLALLPLRTSRTRVKPLSPFDNLVINRSRMKHLFDFDYQLECYLPEQKRRYGYFVLPLLLGDGLVGRMDAKADRTTGQLVIRNLVLEQDTALTESLVAALKAGLQEFACENGCHSFILERASPRVLQEQVFDSSTN